MGFSFHVGNYWGQYLDLGAVFDCKSDSQADALFKYLKKKVLADNEWASFYRNYNVLLVTPMNTHYRVSEHYGNILFNLK